MLHRFHPKKPLLILVMGVAGAGKSTLSREILRRVCAVYLDNNHIVDAFFPNTRRGSRYEKLRPGFYQALYTIASENLKRGVSVLLDVPHVKEVQNAEWRDSMQSLARDAGASLVILRCACSEQTLRKRVVQRNETRDRWKLDHWGEFLAEQPIRARIPLPHLSLDTDKSLSANTKVAVQYIKNQSQVMEVVQ